jgi:integrase
MTRARRGHDPEHTATDDLPRARARTRARRRNPRGWGKVRQLPSSRFQASYLDATGTRRNAPATFGSRLAAEAWLARQRAALDAGTWRDPQAGAATFAGYARTWLADRELKPRTKAGYQAILDRHLIPAFGTTPLRSITPALVRSWYATLDPATPVMRAHAYALLRTILKTAEADDLIATNPARIRRAGSAKRTVRIKPATLAELEVIAAAMPPRLALMVLLAAWCGLRYGELAELRRGDVDPLGGVLHVRRGVVRVAGGWVAGEPKSAAGIRDVAIPPHLLPAVTAHLDKHTGPAPDALLFPGQLGGYLSPASLYDHFYPAREAARRPDLRFHDLRHTGATLAAATGATMAELMRRLGHSSPAAAMRYQHAADDRDAAIASALSEFAGAKVVALRPRRKS